MDILFNLIKDYFLKELETKDSKYRQNLSTLILDYLDKTEDGSFTLNVKGFNNTYQRMHTFKGAITESFEKFVNPFDMDNTDLNVLDICSGLGYNSAALIEEFSNKFNNSNNNDLNNPKLHIDMVEISPWILSVGLLIPSPIKSHEIIKKVIEDKLIENGVLSLNLEKGPIPENIYLKLFCEDVRVAIKKLPSNRYDGIFLDPFSPDLCPELFTVDFFIQLKRIIKDNGVLMTYTSSAPVRSGLIEAGFYVGEGPIFGKKTGGTIGSLSLSKIKNNLPENDERLIALSDLGIPLRDLNLDLSSDIILNNRKEERMSARSNYKISSAVKTPIFLGKDIGDEKLKRRVLKNLNQMNILSLSSKKAIFLVSPQNSDDNLNFISNSKDRIKKMAENLQELINISSKSVQEF
ncbi:MAG: SAM-dependent methyltransferase [Methanobrevibacter sp.]|jgi:tRNA U34 5-methylaminomethyl-2-thiouridine-forming methyltransferase MnmC|nr:SAM-dependent methyltransferase [Methanobrevibacter sp.]